MSESEYITLIADMLGISELWVNATNKTKHENFNSVNEIINRYGVCDNIVSVSIFWADTDEGRYFWEQMNNIVIYFIKLNTQKTFLPNSLCSGIKDGIVYNGRKVEYIY